MWLNCTHFKLFLEKNNKIVARIVEKYQQILQIAYTY